MYVEYVDMYVCVNYTLCTCMVGTCAHLHVVLRTTSTSTSTSLVLHVVPGLFIFFDHDFFDVQSRRSFPATRWVFLF